MSTPNPRRTSITQVKHYRLLDQVGAGGMGSVYEGIDARDASRVAVKLLHPWLVEGDPTFRDRFEREAHIAALLRSPYTVHLLDFGHAEGAYFLVMEFIEGASLAKELQAGPFDPARALRVGIEVARALEEAAARGVAHRDIKPDNILSTADGRIKVADFGIARQAGGTSFTSTGQFVGTPDFAAPEQLTGEADHRSDIYALGATLYCMLVGHPPFQGRTAYEILRQHQDAEVPLGPIQFLPATMRNPILRCLEKDPRDRYQSAGELSGALERGLAGRGASMVASPRGNTAVPPAVTPPPTPLPPGAPAPLPQGPPAGPLAPRAAIPPPVRATPPPAARGTACGHENPPGSRFCRICGQPMAGAAPTPAPVFPPRAGSAPVPPHGAAPPLGASPEDWACAACGAASRAAHRFCRQCGIARPATAARCASCGDALVAGARFCRRCGQPQR